MNSYYVDFTGSITIRKSEQYNEDEFVKKLDTTLGEGDLVFGLTDESDDEVSIWFNGYKSQFVEDEVVDLLVGIADIMCEGEIEYWGSDCTLWRYIWIQGDDARWVRQEGYVSYYHRGTTLERRALA